MSATYPMNRWGNKVVRKYWHTEKVERPAISHEHISHAATNTLFDMRVAMRSTTISGKNNTGAK